MPPDNLNSAQGIESAILAVAQALANQTITTAINPSKCSVYSNAGGSLGSGDSIVRFDTKLYDTANDFDLTLDRFVARYSGYHRVTFTVAIGANASAHNAQIRKNGALWIIGQEVPSGLAGTLQLQCSDDIYLVAGDYLEFWAYNSNGAARSYLAGFIRTKVNVALSSIQ